MKRELIDSFTYALNGIIQSIKDERNLKIQLSIMILVIILALLLNISLLEWIICIILFALVISAEIFNTAIENAVDFTENVRDVHERIDSNARLAKDASAGAVLVLSLASSIIGLMIFIPRIMLFL